MPPKKPPTTLKRLKPLTYHQTVIEMLKFLEVCIHTILFVRRIYPTELFTKRKIYDAPVYQSRHPDLNKYISGAVKSVGDELVRGTVERVVLVIRDRENIAIERFLFNFSGFISIPEDADWQKWQNIESAMTAPVLAQYFRSFLIRLGMLDSYLGVIPAQWDPTFAVVMEMKEGNIPAEPLTKAKAKDKPPREWVPAVPQNTTEGTTAEAENHIIRAVDTGIISLSLIVQESEEKLLRVTTQEDSMGI
ncbi:DNA-binding protein [Serendipita vermifera]|nr:DNA-binding protein [Serendipita vermifera]